MDLLQGCEREAVRAESRLEFAAVGADVFWRVPFHEAEIEELFAVEGTDAANASAETVNKPRKFTEGAELENLQVAGFAEGPRRRDLAMLDGTRSRLTGTAFRFRRSFPGTQHRISIMATSDWEKIVTISARTRRYG